VSALSWLVIAGIVAITGQRFSTAYLDYGWQIIPWDVLTDQPLSSVWYLHVQPPLWNLVLGLLGWINPWSDAGALLVLQMAFGAATAAGAAHLARLVGLASGPSIAVALVATLHPEVLKNAFEPTYELAVAALLVWSVVVIGRAAETRKGWHGPLMAIVLLTAVVLTRSLYHPLWLVAVAATAVVAGVGRALGARRLVVLALIPLVLIGGWMTKNQVLFERATLSSWFGMNLQRAVIPVLDADDLAQMFDDGELSDVARIGPFGDFDLYAPYEPAASCTVERTHRAVAVADRTTDPSSPNFNYECYLPVFDQAGDDAWAVIRAHPEVWLEGRLWSARVMMAVSPMPSESPSGVMRGLDAIYSLLRVDMTGSISTTGWGTPIYGSLEAPADFGLLPVALYAMSVLIGGVHVVSILRRRTRSTARSVVLAVAGMTAAWTFVVGIVGELGEQARFRTMTDALVWATVIAFVVGRLGVGQEQADEPGR
jgi:hypothetical protein